MSNLKKLEQGRAAFAYECANKQAVKQANNQTDKKTFAEDYKQLVKKVPMLIKTNGLGATFAFLQSKSKNMGDNEHTQILVDVAAWLKQDIKKDLIYKKSEKEQGNDFDKKDKDLAKLMVERTMGMESPEYRAITIEVLAFLNWLKRFSDGLIKKQES